MIVRGLVMIETVRLESVRDEYLLGCQIEGKARGGVL